MTVDLLKFDEKSVFREEYKPSNVVLFIFNKFDEVKKVSNFFMGSEEVKPKISGIPDLQGKRILLCDDTTYTGLTIMNCVDWA